MQVVPLFKSTLSAIENQERNRVLKMRQKRKTLLTKLDAKAPLSFSQGGTVETLIKGLQGAVEEIALFAHLCHMVAMMNNAEATLEIQNWFGNILERYDGANGYQGPLHDHDLDFYKFVGQELYTVLISCLLKEEKWRIIQKLFSEWIPVSSPRPNYEPRTATFKDISRFIGSLHYESEKRHKLSL